MHLQRYAIVIVCLAMFAFAVSAPAKAEQDAPLVNAVVQPPCNEAAFDAALNTVQAGGGGTITFNCGTALVYFNSAKVITKNVTIDGGNTIILSGQGLARHFLLTKAFQAIECGQLTLKNITLTNGSTQNGGYGGSIYVTGCASLFTDNVIFQQNTSGNYAGSAIIADRGAITLNNTTVQSNTTTSYGAVNSTGPLTITNSILRGNRSDAGGGAISASGKVLIQNTTFDGNTSILIGSAIYYFGTPGLTLQNSTVSNHAGYAIRNATKMTIIGSTITNNTVGLFTNPDDYLTQDGAATLTNVTFSNNQAALTVGSYGSSSLLHVTFVSNAYGISIPPQPASLYLKNVVIQQPNPAGGNNCLFQPSSWINSGGSNLSSDTSCAAYFNDASDKNAVASGLGPLADNGGPTLTHLPQAGSPLIDAGGCIGGITTDQRGLPRPQGLSCDIGAVEVQPPAPQPSPSPSPSPIVPRARIPIVVK